jgi:hypothetical protein
MHPDVHTRLIQVTYNLYRYNENHYDQFCAITNIISTNLVRAFIGTSKTLRLGRRYSEISAVCDNKSRWML